MRRPTDPFHARIIIYIGTEVRVCSKHTLYSLILLIKAYCTLWKAAKITLRSVEMKKSINVLN